MEDDESGVGVLLPEGQARMSEPGFALRPQFEWEPKYEQGIVFSETHRRAIDAVVSQAARGAQFVCVMLVSPGLEASAAAEAAAAWRTHTSEVLDRFWRIGSRGRELAVRRPSEERLWFQLAAAVTRVNERVDELSESLGDRHSEERGFVETTSGAESTRSNQQEERQLPTVRPLHVDNQGFITSGAVYGEQSFNRSSVRATAMVVNVEDLNTNVASGDYPVPKPSVSTCCEAGREVEMNESEGLRSNVRNGDDKTGVRPAFCGGE
jgi:hypothetical protein